MDSFGIQAVVNTINICFKELGMNIDECNGDKLFTKIVSLENELDRLRSEEKRLSNLLDKSEETKAENQDLISVLNRRLEELCYFLNSLLKQKAVLGFLGSEQASRVKKAVDVSLNLSHTLSANLTLVGDESLKQLSNITDLLNLSDWESASFTDFMAPKDEKDVVFSIEPDDLTLTYNYRWQASAGTRGDLTKELDKKTSTESVPGDNEEFVDAVTELGTSIHAYKQCEAARIRPTEAQSESESWSEPDRAVSQARIGLSDESIKRPSPASKRGKTHLSNIYNNNIYPTTEILCKKNNQAL